MIRFILAFLLTLSGVHAQVPPDRRIEWKPGVRDGIPTRTNLINVKNAPYQAKGDGQSDDKAAIQKAIDAATAEQVVYLPRGTYKVSGGLTLNGKSISIRGDGPDATLIRYDGSSGIDIIKCTRGSDYGNPIDITAGLEKGSTKLTLTSASSVNVGDIIWVSQENDPDFVINGGDNGFCSWCGRNDGNRVMTQMDKVLAKTSNTVTLERPLYLTFKTSLHPQLRTCATVTRVGIESLKVARTNISAGADGSNLVLSLCDNSWITNCASQNPGRRHIFLEMCYACEVGQCDLRSDPDWWHNYSDHNYGIFMFSLNSDHLINDNIVFRCRHGLIFEGGGSGCVVAYNYSVGNVSEPDKDWLSGDLDTHGPHPFMNLFEGNVTSKLAHDNTFGSASHNTSFRNHVVNWSVSNTTPTSGRWAMDIQQHSYYNNLVGNVIGQPGDTGERFAKTGISGRTLASYRFGFECPGCGTVTDPKVEQTTLVSGNYDYIGKGVIWDETSGHVLPSSLYLTTRPSFWPASLPWPAFGPDLNPMVGVIPAELRYNGQAPPVPTPTPAPTATPEPPRPTPTPRPPVQTFEKWIENLNNWIRANPPTPDQ